MIKQKKFKGILHGGELGKTIKHNNKVMAKVVAELIKNGGCIQPYSVVKVQGKVFLSKDGIKVS